jgi:hypothetical protein
VNDLRDFADRGVSEKREGEDRWERDGENGQNSSAGDAALVGEVVGNRIDGDEGAQARALSFEQKARNSSAWAPRQKARSSARPTIPATTSLWMALSPNAAEPNRAGNRRIESRVRSRNANRTAQT